MSEVPESLRQAQQEVRNYTDAAGKQPYISPYYWAGFVFIDGEYENPMPW